jgi:hypothetical protein
VRATSSTGWKRRRATSDPARAHPPTISEGNVQAMKKGAVLLSTYRQKMLASACACAQRERERAE